MSNVIVKKVENNEDVTESTSNIIDEQIANIKDDVITKSNCKLCNSELRAEAEKYYEEKNRNARSVFIYLTSQGEEISYPSVKNHLECHYLEMLNNIQSKDYLLHLKDTVNDKSNKEKHLRLSIAILEDRLLKLASETSRFGAEEHSRQKTVTQLTDLVKTISELYEKLDNLYGEDKKVSILMNQFKDVISIEINNASNENVKRVLMTIVDNFSQRVEQLNLE